MESEIHGHLTIARGKVASVVFGDGSRAPAARLGERDKPAGPASAAQAVPTPAGKRDDLDEVLKQFRAGGVSARDRKDLEKMVPLLAAPQVSKHFNEQLQKLRDGSLNVQGIRQDAIRTRDQVKALTKDMGPEVREALSGYLGILEQFIQETAPAPEKKK